MLLRINDRFTVEHWDWKCCFAWLPIRINETQIVWLEWVYYRCCADHDRDLWTSNCKYEYARTF